MISSNFQPLQLFTIFINELGKQKGHKNNESIKKVTALLSLFFFLSFSVLKLNPFAITVKNKKKVDEVCKMFKRDCLSVCNLSRISFQGLTSPDIHNSIYIVAAVESKG